MSNLLLKIIFLTGCIASIFGCLPAKAQTLSTGAFTNLFLCTPDSLWQWGFNNSGNFGNGSTVTLSVPSLNTQVTLGNLKAVSAGNDHSLFLKADGTVLSSGMNFNGQLGDGTNLSKSYPVQVMGVSGIIAVNAGRANSLFVKNDGTVWGTGENDFGELGNGNPGYSNIPSQSQFLTDIKDVSSSNQHALFLKNDGTVWAAGLNNFGQLGTGDDSNRTFPIKIDSLSGIVAMAAGYFYSLFLKNDGTVWGCGMNYLGQLGDGTTTGRFRPVQTIFPTSNVHITRIAAGADHSLFLGNDGVAYSTGDNFGGQLGDGTTNPSTTPINLNIAAGLTDVVDISAGRIHSVFLKQDGTLWACGLNGALQIGDGTDSIRTKPVMVANIKCTGSLSINDHKINNPFSFSPNPASDNITIAAGNNQKPTTYRITDQTGRRMLHGYIQKSTTTVDVSALAAGLYFLQIGDGNEQFFKLLKN